MSPVDAPARSARWFIHQAELHAGRCSRSARDSSPSARAPRPGGGPRPRPVGSRVGMDAPQHVAPVAADRAGHPRRCAGPPRPTTSAPASWATSTVASLLPPSLTTTWSHSARRRRTSGPMGPSSLRVGTMAMIRRMETSERRARALPSPLAFHPPGLHRVPPPGGLPPDLPGCRAFLAQRPVAPWGRRMRRCSSSGSHPAGAAPTGRAGLQRGPERRWLQRPPRRRAPGRSARRPRLVGVRITNAVKCVPREPSHGRGAQHLRERFLRLEIGPPVGSSSPWGGWRMRAASVQRGAAHPPRLRPWRGPQATSTTGGTSSRWTATTPAR